MKIERNTTTTLRPRAFEALLQRQHVKYYNTHWELRQPIGIYNVSLANVLDSFREVLDELESVLEKQVFREMPPARWDKTLIRRQEDLISRLMRHFDDCFNMLCCFFPRQIVNMSLKELQKDQKSVKKDPHIQAAWDAVSSYREHVANIINHIKHHQGMLRGVVVFNDDVVVPGYFVEHVNQDEALEPHPDVHREFEGHATAFSFYRDLRYKLWLVYVVGEHVADAISQIEATTTPIPHDIGDESDIVSVISRIASLPTRLFKDETNLPFPHIAVTNKNGVTGIHMEFPSQSTILVPLIGTHKVSTGWIGDGVTKSFRPPYFLGVSDHGKAYKA